jgi:hypothetical protein
MHHVTDMSIFLPLPPPKKNLAGATVNTDRIFYICYYLINSWFYYKEGTKGGDCERSLSQAYLNTLFCFAILLTRQDLFGNKIPKDR